MILFGYVVAFSLIAAVDEIARDFVSVQQEYNLTSADYFDPEEYLVGFGDNIWISFPGGVPFARAEESISTIVIPVGLDGYLNVPGMPPVNVDGLNLAQLQSIIEEMVRRNYGSFAVTSGLARSANFEVPVTGQISRPGIVTVNGLTRLSQAIVEAGGGTATAALSRVLIVTIEGDSTFCDLNEFTMNGSLSSNPLMHRNSRIHVFPSEASIILEGALAGVVEQNQEGAVQAEQVFPESKRVVLEYIPDETPFEALQRAGGISVDSDIYSLCVHRREVNGNIAMFPFDLQSVEPEIFLAPGDRIVVPFSNRLISVTGEVRSPSSVSYSPGMTVNYYIGIAGGFTGAARQGSLKLICPDGDRKDAELSDIVPPGAIIMVPRVAVHFWQEYMAILTGVATVIITYHSLSN